MSKSTSTWECPNCGKPYDKRTACWCCISMEGRMWTSVPVDDPHLAFLRLSKRSGVMYLGPIGKPFHKQECQCEECCQWMVDEIEQLREELANERGRATTPPKQTTTLITGSCGRTTLASS